MDLLQEIATTKKALNLLELHSIPGKITGNSIYFWRSYFWETGKTICTIVSTHNHITYYIDPYYSSRKYEWCYNNFFHFYEALLIYLSRKQKKHLKNK